MIFWNLPLCHESCPPAGNRDGGGTVWRQRENPSAATLPHDPKTLACDRFAADGPTFAVGGQCRGGSSGQRFGAAHHAQLFTLGRGLVHFVATGGLGFAAQQRNVAALAAFCPAQFAGRGLLQRAAIPGAANLHPAECDLGGGQWPGLDAGHWGAVFSGAGAARPGVWGGALDSWRAGGVVAGRLGTAHGGAFGGGRFVHLIGHRLLVLVQLVAQQT